MSYRNIVTRRPAFCSAIAAVLVACVCLGAADEYEARTWTSAGGTFSVEATFVEKDGDSVTLRRTSGSDITVKLSQLSPGDREYVKSLFPDEEESTDDGEERQKITTAAGVEEEASKMPSAKQVVLIYQFHLANDDLPELEKRKARERLKHWKELAEKDYQRLGEDWVSPEEAKKKQEEYDKKIHLAFEQLNLGNGERAEELLKEASKIHPEAIEAEWIMGIVYSILVDNQRKAIIHYNKCLEREPSNVGVINNLAIAYFKDKDYNKAADCFVKCVEISPETPALGQNIGTYLFYASNVRNFRVAKRRLDAVNKAYEDLISEHGQKRAPKPGFVPLPPAGLQPEHEKKKGGKNGELVVVGSGSGFVIAEHYVATNHHVIEGQEQLMIIDPKNNKKHLKAELVAADEKIDIAILKCPDLDAKVLKLCTKLPGRGSDIAVFGYPLGAAYGTTVKFTKGNMVAMPDAANDNMCLYDALTNPGNSGGPLVDKAGRVVGVVRAIKGYIGGVYGMAIPMETAYPFMVKHVPNIDKPVTEDVKDELSWSDVDGILAPSTVMILNKRSTASMSRD